MIGDWHIMKTKILSNFIFLLIFIGILLPVGVQAARQGQGASDSSYRELIKKNFESRKQLKELEKRYIRLEEERKLLIYHIKELQEKLEGLKKRKVRFERQNNDLTIQNNDLEKELKEMQGLLGTAKMGLMTKKEEFNRVQGTNQQLAKELKETRAGLGKQDRLSATLEETKKEKVSLEKKRN